MIRPMARGAVAVPVEPVLARKEAVQRVQQVIVRPRTDLHDDEPRGRVGHEHRQQAVTRVGDIIEECRAGSGEVGQASRGPGADGELARLYGKMLRRASRIRPIPPPAGADS